MYLLNEWSQFCFKNEEENADYAENEVYKNLRAQNVKPKVVVALMELYEATDMTPEDIDERALEMIRSLPTDHAEFVIKEVFFEIF